MREDDLVLRCGWGGPRLVVVEFGGSVARGSSLGFERVGLIRVHLLGGFVVEQDGQNLPPIPSSVGRSLFAYLVTNREYRHTRDLLAGIFWPDVSEQAARRRLSQALWQIQSALHGGSGGQPLIDASSLDVSIAAGDFWLDVSEFDALISIASNQSAVNDPAEVVSLERALQLYRGEFLAGFYDEWMTFERDRLRTQYLCALERLTELHKSRADYEAGLSFARQLCLHDPFRESAHREVMRLSFLVGRSNEALQQFDRCAEILLEELGASPSLATVELRLQIQEMRDKGDHPFVPTIKSPLLGGSGGISLVGRMDERRQVLRRMEETILGRGGAVFIEGKSGVGKTRLLEELIDDAQWRGLTPLVAECSEAEMLHPMHGLLRALESGLTRLRFDQLRAGIHPRTLADLGRVQPTVRTWLDENSVDTEHVEDPSTVDRSIQAIRTVLLALAELSPTVLFIDDVQWLDEESAAVLADLAGELMGRGLLLVLSFREFEARDRRVLWSRLAEIDARAKALKLTVSPLDPVESTRLIEESLGVTRVDHGFTEALYLSTGGNPLFILESLRAWHEAEIEDFEPGFRTEARSAHPPTTGVTSVILRRLQSVSSPARRVLETAAVLGTLAEPELIATVAGQTVADSLHATADLVRRGLLRETESGYECSHDQIRGVVLDLMDAEDLRSAGERAGFAIEQAYPDRVEDLAYHFTAAQTADRAFKYSFAAGIRAGGVGAFETAVKHFEKAAVWADGPDRYVLFQEWDDALDVLGHRVEQKRILGELTQLAHSPSELGDLARRRSRLLLEEGNHKQAITAAFSALDYVADGVDSIIRGRMRQNLGLTLARTGRALEGIPHLEAAIEDFANDMNHRASALCDLGNVQCEVQEYASASEALTEAMEHYSVIGNVRGIAEVSGQLAIVSMELGDGDRAVDLYSSTIEICRDLDYRRGEAVNLANLANALYSQGQVGLALIHYGEAATVFSEIGDRFAKALVNANVSSVRHLVLGDDGVESDIRASLEFFETEVHPWGQAFCHEHLAAIYRRRGDLAEARRLVNSGLALLGSSHRWVEVHLRRVAAEVELDAGSLTKADQHIELAVKLCNELGLADIAPTLESLASMVALRQGDGGAALIKARKATKMLRSGTELPHLVWFRLYVAADAGGEGSEGRHALRRASDQLEAVLDSLSATDRELARIRVPETEAIIYARDRTFPRIREVTLPSSSARRGRTLTDDDWIKIRWTSSDPSDFDCPDPVANRHARMRRFVQEATHQGADPRVEDLAFALGASVSTIRRDLADLRRSGERISTRGHRNQPPA